MTDAPFAPVDFLAEFVRRPSHESVDDARDLLLDTLRAHDVTASVDDAGNVVATRRSRPVRRAEDQAAGDATAARSDAEPTGAGTHVVLNTHLDTVPPHVPYEREEADGVDVIRGRGSCDAGGPLAALLAAFLAVDLDDDISTSPGMGRDGGRDTGKDGGSEEGRAGDAVTLAVTPDEETLSRGAHHLVSGDGGEPVPAIQDADAFVVGEPTDLAVCTAAKGRFQGTLTLGGENAHAAEPGSGTNAVAALEDALGAIRTFDDRPDAPPVHDQLGRATLTPTVVDGGTATNQVPATASVVLDRRSVPPETAAGFADALRAHVRARVRDDVAVDFEFTDRDTPFLEAWATDGSAAVVDAFTAAGADSPRPFGAATEASYFADLAPTVVFGPGVLADDDGAVAHAPREYVHVDDVERAAQVATDALQSLLSA